MTPNEITTLIASEYGKELDTRFKLQLYERVKYWRSTLIKQSLDKVRTDLRFFRQTMYIPMEAVADTDCTMNCHQSRTTIEIPQAIRVTDNGIYTYVGGVDGYSSFGYADAGTLKFLTSGKYSKKTVFHEVINARVYVTLPDVPKIRVDAVLDNPEEGFPYQSCDGDPDMNCNWWDIEIPMSNDITQRVVQCILTVDYNRLGRSDDHQIAVNGTNKPTEQ